MNALLQFDPPTALRFVGFVYGLMAATVWVLLDNRHERTGLTCWCLGSAGIAVAGVLYGLRGTVPDWLSLHVANLMIYASYPLRVLSLRIEMRAAPRHAQVLGIYLAAAAAFLLLDHLSVNLRVQYGAWVQCLGSGWLALTALKVARVTGLRSALWIAGAYSAMSLALLVMSVGLMYLSPAPPINVNNHLGLLLVLLAGSAAGLYGNFGYVGMTLERLRSHDLTQTAALAREAALRSAAVQRSEELQGLLSEREEMLRLLAHEVRQPLNNASAALQSASIPVSPAADGTAMAADAVDQRVQRARRVLGQIIGTLDNALAATTTLAGSKQISIQDADLDLLIGLSLGDLDSTQRWRVEVERLTPARTVTLDFGLLRLALRNLLSNALIFSPPGSAVLLRVSETDEPLALVFDVLDRGPGLEPGLQDRLFLRGERGRDEASGHGLGLYVVRRVAEVHGGHVTVQPRDGGGLVFSLVLPQGRGD